MKDEYYEICVGINVFSTKINLPFNLAFYKCFKFHLYTFSPLPLINPRHSITNSSIQEYSHSFSCLAVSLRNGDSYILNYLQIYMVEINIRIVKFGNYPL